MFKCYGKRLLAILALWLGLVTNGQASLISFSGQFDPSLAGFSTGGGNGWLDTSGTPASLTIWGSDSWTAQPILTLVTWNVVTGIPALEFFWSYETFDWDGPSWDPAGYYLNGDLVQLTDSSGPDAQSGYVTLALNSGDLFGFWVFTVDDIEGPARLTISGVPEPGTLALVGLGGLSLLGARRRLQRRC